ncbi:MAG: hypothetical protein J6Y37_16370 [Paludibacteraceae bacterium]|nr:hypothetical protein [Paludibacteraceae bacterium]
MDDTVTEGTVKKKRGRKPNPSNRSGYFCEEEEAAFREYMESDNKLHRDKIFREKLYPAFTKMIESIIRRYGLFTPSEDFEDTFHDTMGFLATKMDKFDFSKGYKAYSYFGTICKRHLLLKRTQDMKKTEMNQSIDSLSSGIERRLDNDADEQLVEFNTELIRRNAETLERMLNDDSGQMTKNERNVGYALLDIFNNWEEIFSVLKKGKFNKASFLFFVKEYTRLSTKEVREAMKKYKTLYYGIKADMINE